MRRHPSSTINTCSTPRPMWWCDPASIWLGGLCAGSAEGETSNGGPEDTGGQTTGGQCISNWMKMFHIM